MEKSNRHRNLIIPIIFGALFYGVLMFVQRATLYLLFPQLSLLIVTCCAIALYAFIIGVLSHKINLLAG